MRFMNTDLRCRTTVYCLLSLLLLLSYVHGKAELGKQIQECMKSTEKNNLVPFTDIFWLGTQLFNDTDVNERCAWDIGVIDGVEALFIDCEWSEPEEAFRGKGIVYEIVEQACAQTKGMMYLAHQLNTTYEVELQDKKVIESTIHRNVPLCLAPGCTAEIVLDEIGMLPCSQWDRFPFYDFDTENWYNTTDSFVVNSNCTHDLNVASTFMDEFCETKHTYNVIANFSYSCSYDRSGGTRLCDYSSFTEPSGIDFEEDFCDFLDADFYKYSVKNYILFDEALFEDFYHLNNPTCLKRGCDVQSYYMENILPYHAINTIDIASKDVGIPDYEEKILETTGIGIAPVITNEASSRFMSGSTGKRKGKKGKKAKKVKRMRVQSSNSEGKVKKAESKVKKAESKVKKAEGKVKKVKKQKLRV